MLYKKPTGRPPLVGKILGFLLIGEALAFGAGYFVWSKLNKSRDIRQQAKESAPWALELYYKFGETIDSKNKVIREQDAETWEVNRIARNKE